MNNNHVNLDNQDITTTLQPFFKELAPKLEQVGFDEQQQKNIELKIIETQKVITQRNSTYQSEEPPILDDPDNQASENWHKILEYVANDPNKILSIFKNNNRLSDTIFDFTIAFLVITALIILSLWGNLEPTHTATLLSGIIGYLLGSSR